MKKKFIFISIWSIILFVLINIFYGFFYEDDITNIIDKLTFRKEYYSREIIEDTLDYTNNEHNHIITKNNFSLELLDITYEQDSGLLNANFNFYTNNEQDLDKLCFMLRVHDNQKIFYNYMVGSKLFVGNLDYLLYNNNLYYKLSERNLDTHNLNDNNNFKYISFDDNKNMKLTLYLGKNYKISNNFYIEFLDIVYKPQNDNSYKVFKSLGEFRFSITF